MSITLDEVLLNETEPKQLWNEILPNLWQGGTHDDDVIGNKKFADPYNGISSDGKPFITKEDFDTVITMYQHANPVGWYVNEMRYTFPDASIALIDKRMLRTIVDYAYDSWKAGEQVLIRCQAGLNRSGLVMALVLIKEGYEPAEAIALIRDKRSGWALCNRQYEAWLTSLDVAEWRD